MSIRNTCSVIFIIYRRPPTYSIFFLCLTSSHKLLRILLLYHYKWLCTRPLGNRVHICSHLIWESVTTLPMSSALICPAGFCSSRSHYRHRTNRALVPQRQQYIGRRPTSWPLGSWPKTGLSFDSHVIRCASAPVNGPDAGEPSLCAKQTRRLTWCRAIAMIGCVGSRERLCPGRANSEQAIPSSCALQRPLPFPEGLLSTNVKMIWIHIQ